MIKQIDVRRGDNDTLSYKPLLLKLANDGYALLHGLDDLTNISDFPAICIDIEKRKVFCTNVTCLACWCSSHPKKYQLNISDVINNYNELIIKGNDDLFDQLTSFRYYCK